MGLVLLNLLLSVLSVPGIILFVNYYKYSKNKKIIISHDKIILQENENIAGEITNTEITEIELVHATDYSGLPWSDFAFFVLKDAKGNRIIVPNFIMEISELWLDTLSRKIKRSNIIKTRKSFPSIPLHK